MSLQVLKTQIFSALNTTTDATTASNQIADAIDAYVMAKLAPLTVILKAPGAFTGGGPAPIVPGAISTYNPAV